MNYSTFLLIPVLTLFTLLTVKCQMVEFPSENAKFQPNPNPVLNQPKFPGTPDCMGFPGSPQWNKCWAKFHGDMANFQHAMESYAEKVKKQASTKPNGTSGNYYSNSYSSYSSSDSGFTSKSSLSINGYYINAVGISVSAQTTNGVMKISFNCGNDMEYFESKADGPELELKVVSSSGQKKSATIRLPPKIKMEQIKVERKGDIILVTGPAGNDNNYSSTSFSSSDFGPGKLPAIPPIPQIPPMPQFPSYPTNYPFGNNMWMF